MSEWMSELLFWIVVFAVFFYGFRWLQQRKKSKDDTTDQNHSDTDS